MLAKWIEILPLFVVRWLALRKCERFTLTRGAVVAGARPDVLFYVKGCAADAAELKRLQQECDGLLRDLRMSTTVIGIQLQTIKELEARIATLEIPSPA